MGVVDGIGASLKRKEDLRFLSGRGNYVDDLNRPNQTIGYFLRSDVPHGKLVSVDTSAALKMPGVVAIFTGEDFAAVGGVPCGTSERRK